LKFVRKLRPQLIREIDSSWCFSPDGIQKKLLDAPKSDYPRYGDDPAKTQVAYIKRLIQHGKHIFT
jgi:hypothetical protein